MWLRMNRARNGGPGGVVASGTDGGRADRRCGNRRWRDFAHVFLCRTCPIGSDLAGARTKLDRGRGSILPLFPLLRRTRHRGRRCLAAVLPPTPRVERRTGNTSGKPEDRRNVVNGKRVSVSVSLGWLLSRLIKHKITNKK